MAGINAVPQMQLQIGAEVVTVLSVSSSSLIVARGGGNGSGVFAHAAGARVAVWPSEMLHSITQVSCPILIHL